jgi:hypothetical protein
LATERFGGGLKFSCANFKCSIHREWSVVVKLVDANIKYAKIILFYKIRCQRLLAKFHIVHCGNTHNCLYVHIFTFSNLVIDGIYIRTHYAILQSYIFQQRSDFYSIIVNIVLVSSDLSIITMYNCVGKFRFAKYYYEYCVSSKLYLKCDPCKLRSL